MANLGRGQLLMAGTASRNGATGAGPSSRAVQTEEGWWW